MTLSTLTKLTTAALFLTTAVLVASTATHSIASEHRGTGPSLDRITVAFRASGRLQQALAYRASGRVDVIAYYRGSERGLGQTTV